MVGTCFGATRQNFQESACRVQFCWTWKLGFLNRHRLPWAERPSLMVLSQVLSN